jgi:peptidoglycan/xylan/chitin deacetylase (PgdA/CDA1 family)
MHKRGDGMRIFFFTKKGFIRGMSGFVFLGLLAFIFLQMIKPQVAAVPAQAIYQGNSGQKTVALCINVDWGEEYIPAMLEEFKKAQAQVTFFVTGSWAEKNPELLKQMSEAGHSIQNHAYKHVHFSSLSDAEARSKS